MRSDALRFLFEKYGQPLTQKTADSSICRRPTLLTWQPTSVEIFSTFSLPKAVFVWAKFMGK